MFDGPEPARSQVFHGFSGEAPSLLHEQFHRELEKLEEWEQTMILATLQRIATMMDAEQIEAAPVLGADVAGAAPEEAERYLGDAAVLSGELALAKELPRFRPFSWEGQPRTDAPGEPL